MVRIVPAGIVGSGTCDVESSGTCAAALDNKQAHAPTISTPRSQPVPVIRPGVEGVMYTDRQLWLQSMEISICHRVRRVYGNIPTPKSKERLLAFFPLCLCAFVLNLMSPLPFTGNWLQAAGDRHLNLSKPHCNRVNFP
jgi:hypothetical protein